LFDKSDYHEGNTEYTDSNSGHCQLGKKYVRSCAHLAIENDNTNHERIANEAHHERQKQDGELQEGDTVHSHAIFVVRVRGIHIMDFKVPLNCFLNELFTSYYQSLGARQEGLNLT